MKKLLTWSLLGLVIGLTGCAATGPQFTEVSASMPPVKPAEARVVFYRGTSMLGAAIRPEIRMDGFVVGRSERGSFFYVDTSPGAHVVSASTEAESNSTIDVPVGKTAYVSSSISMGLMVGRVQLRQEPEVTALSELSGLAFTGSQAMPAASRAASPAAASISAAPAAPAAPGAPTGEPLRAGDEVEYTVTDRFTNQTRRAVYRVDRVEGGQVFFNQGTRIERTDGEVLKIETNVGGDMDAFSPPGGWGKGPLAAGQRQRLSYRNVLPGGNSMQFDLDAVALAPTTVHTASGAVPAVPVNYTGWATSRRGTINYQVQVKVAVMYAPTLQRVVRFQSDTSMQSVGGTDNLSSRETTELAAIRRR